VRRRVAHTAPGVPPPILDVRPPDHSTPRPKAHDAVSRDPRAYPPRAAPPNPHGRVADLPARPPAASPAGNTLARRLPGAIPLIGLHGHRDTSLLTPCTHPPIRRPPVRRPPLPPPQRAHPSTRSHRQASSWASPLGPKGAPMTACLPALRRHSPESEPGQKRRHGLAAVARRQPPRPNRCRTSITGEPNRLPLPLVPILRPPFAAGEQTPCCRALL
jgi:hypothetical protein